MAAADFSRRCGTVATGPFQVTALAWRVRMHIENVAVTPRAPGTVFRATPNPAAIPRGPDIAVFDPAFRPVAENASWQALSACG